MFSKLMLATLFFALVSCNNSDMNGQGMMGGMGMMGSPNIPGEHPPLETNNMYVEGYQYAKSTCTQCHDMPNPNLHTSSDWPNVIERMKKNITKFNKNMPDSAVLESIVEYYVANSK